MQLGQQLWTRPVTPHQYDEEFDENFNRDDWSFYNSGLKTVDWDEVDAYDTTYTGRALRVNVNSSRKSWALFQSGDTGTSYFMKPIVAPTNLVMMSRLKFNHRHTGSGAPSIGIVFAKDNSGPDPTNIVTLLLNGSTNVYATLSSLTGGEGGFGTQTTATDEEGQALEYIALQKRGTAYDGWVGTASGNWIYLGFEGAGYTIGWAGFYIYNSSTAAPGLAITGSDFLRFKETDNFLF